MNYTDYAISIYIPGSGSQQHQASSVHASLDSDPCLHSLPKGSCVQLMIDQPAWGVQRTSCAHHFRFRPEFLLQPCSVQR